MRMLKAVHDPVGTATAVGFAILGVLLIFQSQRMSAMGSVFPITISAAMTLLALALVIRNVVLGLRGITPKPASGGGEGGVSGGSNLRRGLFVALMAAWIALLPILGFYVASVIAFFAIMIVATHERLSPMQIAILIALGFAILTGFYLLMANVLLIPMPRGLFF